MKIEQENSLKPKKDSCSISNQQIKFFDKITNDIESLRVSLEALTGKVDARDEVFSTGDLSAINASIGKNLTTENLYVNGLTSLQGDTQANNLTVNGVLSVLNELSAKLLRIEELFANKAHINEADIKSAIIDILRIRETLIRFDTNQKIISFPSENITQLGDIANSIILAGLERPKWNEFPIALLSDVTEGITPIYKGIVNTVEDLPTKADVGDFYIINSVTEKNVTGIGKALFNGEKFDISIFYELLNYYNKDEITKLFDDELIDDLHRETDIIEGKTPVQKVRAGCVDTEGNLLATTDDAFMLYGPEGMDNINPNTSLDDLLICSQYSADDELANTILDKPEGEMGAFDIAVGYFSGNKNDVWQLYVGKTTQKMYFRIADNKSFSVWNNILYPTDISDVVVKRAEQADSLKVGATIGNSEVASINDFFTNSFALNNIPLEANDNIDDLPLGTYATVDFSIFSQIKGNKPFDNPFKLFVFKGGKETDNSQQQLAIEWTSQRIAIRHSNGTSWTAWTQIATLDNNGYVEKAKSADIATSVIDGVKNVSGEVIATTLGLIKNPILVQGQEAFKDFDFDKITTGGIYCLYRYNKNLVLHAPPSELLYSGGFLFVVSYNAFVIQIYRENTTQNTESGIQKTTNKTFYRTYNFAKVWNKWQEVATTDSVVAGTTVILTDKTSIKEIALAQETGVKYYSSVKGWDDAPIQGGSIAKITKFTKDWIVVNVIPVSSNVTYTLSYYGSWKNWKVIATTESTVKLAEGLTENALIGNKKIIKDMGFTSMTKLGFTKDDNIHLTDFAKVLYKKGFNSGNYVSIIFGNAEAANLTDGKTSFFVSGGGFQLITIDDITKSYSVFSAIYENPSGELWNICVTNRSNNITEYISRLATKALLGNQKTFRFENGTLFIDDYVEPVALMAHPVMTLEEPVNMDEDIMTLEESSQGDDNIMTLENKDGDNNELNI